MSSVLGIKKGCGIHSLGPVTELMAKVLDDIW